MMALYFVITGNSPPKVITNGYDTCKVTLDWDGKTRLIRTKRPNRVVIELEGQSFEDDLAQTYIQRIFGRHFEYTSYIQQQYQRTFVYLSPTEKLEILEKLCFDHTGDLDPETLKKQCTAVHRELNVQHIECKTRMHTLSSFVHTPMDPPERPKEPSVRERSQLITQLEEARQALKHTEHAKYLRDRQESIERQLERIQDIEWTEAMLVEQMHTLQQLEKLVPHAHVWSDHSKVDCEELIRDYTRDIGYLKEYRTMEESVERMTKIVAEQEHIQRECERIRQIHEGEYECPECHTHLVLLNDELVSMRPRRMTRSTTDRLSPDQKKKRLLELDAQLQSLRQHTQSLGHYQTRMHELTEFIDPTEDPQALHSDLQWIREYYDTQIRKESQNQMMDQQRDTLQARSIPGLDLKQAQQKLDAVRTRTQLQTTWESYERQLQALPMSQMTVTEGVDRVRYLESQLTALDQLEHAWELYLIKQMDYDTYTSRVTEIKALEQKLQQLERRMDAVSELKQLILKAESDVLEFKLREIRDLVNTYAEQIFVEPITVELRTLKKTATQNEKVQVQLEVFYKNMQCDMSLLSGGEQARLNLAFILAFAHVFHSPLLLLDECTSNLDQELTEIVLEHIESMRISKVILIAHQVVEGNFTQILRM
jgi:ABC-type dipeptide/oligopeptide/nickel transport system ATPase subunit